MLVCPGGRMTLWWDPPELVIDRFPNAAVFIAKIGESSKSSHPWRLRGLAGIHFGTAPKPFLQRDAGKCHGLLKQSDGEYDCGLHLPI